MLLQFQVVDRLQHGQLAVLFAGMQVEHIEVVALVGEAVGTEDVLVVDDKYVVADKIIRLPEQSAGLSVVAEEAAATSPVGAGIADASHVEQQVVVQRIPSDVLNLTVADARDVAEVERSQRCALTVVGNCHEAVVGRDHRSAVERNPAEVDRLRDYHLKVLRSLYSLKVGVPHIVAQTIDIAIGLVGVEQAHAAPVGAVGTHGNEPLRTCCGAKHDCHQAENSLLHN